MLDSFDLRILARWQSQGDIGPVAMSEAVFLSPSQCSRRMQQLKAAGYIRHISAVLEPSHLNLSLCAYVMVTLGSHEREHIEAFHKHICELEEVVECQSLTGEADYILKVVTHDLKSFNALLTGYILTAPGVSTARSSIVLDDFKSTNALPLGHLDVAGRKR